MASRGSAFTAVTGRLALLTLGVLYVAFGLGWAAVEIAQGVPVSNALLIAAFIVAPGVIILYGGYGLPRTTIDPRFYPTITGWCLGAVGAITGLLVIYHFQPAASIDNPVRAILIISGFVLVPAFVGGIKDARSKTREFELKRARDLLQQTERTADVGGWEIDPDTQEVFWTEHLFELLGLPPDEEPPLNEALAMYHEEDRPLVEDAIDTALESGTPFDVEARIRTATGEHRWLHVQGIPEIEDDETGLLRGAAQDITERKEREKALEESHERLEEFASAVSHDLREPLATVASYLQLLERRYDDELDEDAAEFIDFAVSGATRMREMIDGLVTTYSRVESDGKPLAPVDLNIVLDDVLQDLSRKIETSDAEITADRLPTVKCDRGQLQQVLMNLIDNAIKYSGDEPPQINVSAQHRDDMCEISVSDEGIGLKPDTTETVFDVFTRAHSELEYPGTGIGLAICDRIVERHGGDIWVESEPGHGSTFTFTMPGVQSVQVNQ